ncbi:unnamed protein product [Rhizophagus irregularis]|nr:unnamed protein product [Rhizophagus irregularis]
MDEDNELFNPILRILDRRRAVADCVSEIRLFFDQNRIPIPQDIDDIFNATTQSLDEIIRQAALMQEIGVDQLNQIEGLQTLLGESLERTNGLNQDLIRVRADFTYERNGRRHWENITQQQQARIAGLQIANLGIRFLNRRKDAQLANQQNQLVNQQNQIANQQNQIAEHRRNAHRLMLRYNADTERWRRRHAGCIRQARNWQRQYRISQTQVQAQAQNNLNLQQQILALQNNPPNMAAIQDVMQTLAPLLAQLPNYDGQEPPDSYYQKLRGINETAHPLAVAAFNAAARTNVMQSKMIGRFQPVLANNPYNANAAINTEAEFLNWLQGKYRDVMIGTNRAASIAIANEKFSPLDTADTYEKRIRPIAQTFPFNNILPCLYNHLPEHLQMRVRLSAPANLDAFFTEIRNIWLESGGNVGQQNNVPTHISAPLPAQPQRDRALELFADIGQRLGFSGNISKAEDIHNFVEQELYRRLGSVEAHLAKLLEKSAPDTKPSRHRHLGSSTLDFGRRIEEIETHIAKFGKDKRGSKLLQGRHSELERRLGRIESQIAKLSKIPKSKSSQVHITTVSKPEISDNNLSGDNTTNSEDSSSNSEDDINVNVTRAKSPNRSKEVKQDPTHDLVQVSFPSATIRNKKKTSSKRDSLPDDDLVHDPQNPTSAAHNSLSDKASQSCGGITLEETIRKIIQSILKENMPSYIIQALPFITEKCKPLLTQDKSGELRSNIFSTSQELAPETFNSDEGEESIDDPMEIDFVQNKEPKMSIASVECKIKRLKIPAMALDSAAEIPIITEDIVKRVKADIDKSIRYDLSGIATAPTESIGVVHNLPITLVSGCTIYEDFVVVKHPKPMLIFSNPLLKKYRCVID